MPTHKSSDYKLSAVKYYISHSKNQVHLAADRPDRITSRNAWNYCSREVDGIWVSMSDLKAH